MVNNTKTFRLKRRSGILISIVLQAIWVLLMLIATIAGFKASLEGEVVDWRDSWWLSALLLGLFSAGLASSLREASIQLALSEEGIWYSQFGNKRFIPWEQIECVGFTRAWLTREKQYCFILKSEPAEGKETLIGKKQNKQTIPLSGFVDRWLGSELQNEIKRLNPRLLIQ